MTKRIKIIMFSLALSLIFSLMPALAEKISPSPMYPFGGETYRLINGMQVVLIKSDNNGTMMDLLVVDVGMGNEKKPDETEYTHLMEHLLFRKSKNFSLDQVNEIYSKYGIYEQGFTESDFTCYYRKFPKKAFEELTRIMADKLVNLEIGPEEYKAETGAVLGEYQGEYQTPWSMLFSKLYQIAYRVHPYRDVPEHLEVLKKMPQHQDSVMKFYHDYYKPNNCRLVVIGDFDTNEVKKVIEKYYGVLSPGKTPPESPKEPPQEKERTGEVKFHGETSPYLLIGYKLPAYDLNNIEIPSMDLVKELYFTEGSPLYNRLVYEEKLVSSVYFPEHYFCKDPGMFTIGLKLKKAEDIEKVKKVFFEEVDKLCKTSCDPVNLREVKEKTRYKMLTRVDSLEDAGFVFMKFYFLSHNPDGISIYFDKYFKVTPDDIKNTAEKYFTENNRTVITLVKAGKDDKE